MDVVWSLFWLVLAGLLVAGLVLFVIALVRWEMNSWKYLLLALVILPFVGAVAGWVALFAGGTKRRPAAGPTPSAFPPPPPPSPTTPR